MTNKVRVVYRHGGKISEIYLVEKARRPNETDEQMFDRIQAKIPDLQNMPYDDMDASKLPAMDNNRSKWRGAKGKGVWVDNTIVLRREVIEQKQLELDNELAKTQPDTVAIVRLNREIEKLKAMSGEEFEKK
jgi:hypothetical protein